ncbi:MAG: hypothetical protein R2747_07875 [Pyrinomonadaceae bacterium]
MNFWRIATKVFAYFFLIFVSSVLTQAQTTNSDSSIYQLPAGTRILVQMDNEINSKVSSINDTFTAVIAEPVKVREAVVIPIGVVVEGRVTKVKSAAIGRKDGTLNVVFERLLFKSGEKRDISGVLVKELKAEHNEISSAVAILGGTAIGGLLGAISQGENGALIGAGIGAGTGTGIAVLRKGKEVGIKSGEKFEIEITKEVVLPVEDY